MMEPKHKTVFGGRILKRGPAGVAEDPAKVGRAQGLFSSNTDLVLPQASPGAWLLISVFNVYYIIIVHLCF